MIWDLGLTAFWSISFYGLSIPNPHVQILLCHLIQPEDPDM